MGKHKTNLDHAGAPGIIGLLQTAYTNEWNGVIRARSGASIGAIWLVKGHVVHALLIEGKARAEGISALDDICRWRGSTTMLEEGILPPARTIRLDMPAILDTLVRRELQHTQDPLVDGQDEQDQSNLEELFESLRRKVPGLEAVSVTRGTSLERTTLRKSEEKTWLHTQLQSHFFDHRMDPDQLYLQQGDHALLIMRRGPLAAVLMAQNGTAPEALFWAGEEARKRIGMSE